MDSVSSIFSANKEEVIQPILPANVNGMGLTNAFAAASPQIAPKPEEPAVELPPVMSHIEAPSSSFKEMVPQLDERDTQTAARHLSNAMGELFGAIGKHMGVEPKADNENFTPALRNANLIPVAKPAGPTGLL